MVLMLELVGIGVFGACLSALLCIFTEGASYDVPKVISFKDGLLRPRIIRSVNCPKWPIPFSRKDEKLASSINYLAKKIRPDCQKRYSKFRQNVACDKMQAQHFRTQDQMTDVKIMDDCQENNVLAESPDAFTKLCKYCGKSESRNSVKNSRKNVKKLSINNRSFGTINDTLSRRKSDEDSCEKCSRFYSDKWRKKGTKRKRFILPKNLLIGKNVIKNFVTHREVFEEDFLAVPVAKVLPLNGRYCYLEALRIKVNEYENKKCVNL